MGILFLAGAWAFGNPQPGLTTIATLNLLSLGLTMGGIGILGEYVGRIQLEVKRRPMYVIDRKINLD